MKKMRLTSAALSDVAVLLKANLSGWYMLLALLLFSLLMSGCSADVPVGARCLQPAAAVTGCLTNLA